MTGFEDRLRSALRDGTEEAPYAGSLASGARARLRRRRRRAGVVGAVAAVLAVAVPVGVVAGGVDGPQPVDGSGWHTETVGGVSVEVPGGWRAGDGCVAPGGDCEVAEQVSVSAVGYDGSDTPLDPDWSWTDGDTYRTYESELGLSFDDGESVTVGDAIVVATGLDGVTTRRLLASARPEGDPAPDVAEWTTRMVADGITADVPVGENVRFEEVALRRGCEVSEAARPDAEADGWRAIYCGPPRFQFVRASTQALTDVVLRSIRPADEDRDDWRTVTVDGVVALELPSEVTDDEACFMSALYGQCEVSVDVSPDTALMTLPPLGRIEDGEGVVTVGADYWVRVAGLDREVARRILASARLVSEPAPSLSEWGTQTADGPFGPVTVDAPLDAEVELGIAEGVPRCGATGVRSATERPDGSWLATYCRDFVATITAPTRALADVVAQSLREGAPESGSEEWRTVTVDGVSVDLPATVADGDVCWLERCPVGIVNSATIDVVEVPTPGLIDASGGTVFVGEYWVRASGLDFETTRRILASARPEGKPAPPLSEWTALSDSGMTVDVPEAAGVMLLVGTLPRCAATTTPARELPSGEWVARHCGSGAAAVTAATQALTDVVAQTLREADATSTSDPWRTVAVDEALVELPGAWVRDPACAGPRAGRAPTFGPPDPDTDCADLPGVFAGTGVGEEPGPYEPGLQECLGTGWCGLTGAGDVGVLVRGVDRETARRVAASLRGPDDPVVDVSTWVTRSVPSMASRGPSPLVSEVPVGGDVTAVKTIEGFCIDDPDNPIARRAGDAWDIGGCNTGLYVSAPTRAIAEVVFSTVR